MAKSALIVWGGWEGHEPRQSAALFATCLREKNFEVEVSDTLDAYLDADKLRRLDLIVPVWTMDTITKEQEHGLLEAVKSGVGLAGLHGTMGASFRHNTQYPFTVARYCGSHSC